MEYDSRLGLKVLEVVEFYVVQGKDCLYPHHNFKIPCQDNYISYGWNSYSRIEKFS